MTLLALHVREGNPDFMDLPWEHGLELWEGRCPRLVEVDRGLSRHTVLFVAYEGAVYALKELPPALAEKEYGLLRGMEERALPAVQAVGHARASPGGDPTSVLITRYLERSLPYRTLFSQPGLERYRERLLDAMSGLIVRLHLGGFFWGDCSLNNTLFRRDAGELQAYAVDAETSELHERLSSGQREHDLSILEENVAGDLADLALQLPLPPGLSVADTSASIRQRYQRLWAEITREVIVPRGESYRIQERIRALNELGFSVGEFALQAAGDGSKLQLRTIVVDRDYHRRQLHSMTGLIAGERQAALMVNEIRELRATLAQEKDRSLPLSAAAFRWLQDSYRPSTEQLQEARPGEEAPELYCQVLEHKWFLSERAGRDVGLRTALEDYLQRVPPAEGPQELGEPVV